MKIRNYVLGALACLLIIPLAVIYISEALYSLGILRNGDLSGIIVPLMIVTCSAITWYKLDRNYRAIKGLPEKEEDE